QLPPFFFFNDTATTEIYTLSLHDALPICRSQARGVRQRRQAQIVGPLWICRSEEHTSELQSHSDLVCRLLLAKKIHTLESAAPHLPPKRGRASAPRCAAN